LKLSLKKILTYGGLALGALVVIFLVCRIMLNLDAVGAAIGGVFGSLRAIFLGFVMAYLLYPLTRFTEQFLLYHKVKRKTARSLSAAFSALVLLTLIFLFAYFIIPQLVTNLPSLIQSLPGMLQSSAAQLSQWLTDHGQSTDIITQTVNRITETFTDWLQGDPLSDLLDLAGRLVTVGKGVLNFIIGIIVMVYLLLSRDQFVGQGKKLLFALFKKRATCDRILKHIRAINQIFSGFVSGKLLDSLIIGIICIICLSILRIPYALLISIIVGITNIIPVFGPFFGAIPSAFLLLLTDPKKCVIFIIFVIILQQVDGNIIGPKILGNSTGLSAFWVLFALLLFNHLLGFWGMLLGVPLFASFYYLFREFINARLKKRDLPVATQDYVHIKTIAEDGKISYQEEESIQFQNLILGENSILAQIFRLVRRPIPQNLIDKMKEARPGSRDADDADDDSNHTL
jgi:predicted PurR-regulated permease PerM